VRRIPNRDPPAQARRIGQGEVASGAPRASHGEGHRGETPVGADPPTFPFSSAKPAARQASKRSTRVYLEGASGGSYSDPTEEGDIASALGFKKPISPHFWKKSAQEGSRPKNFTAAHRLPTCPDTQKEVASRLGGVLRPGAADAVECMAQDGSCSSQGVAGRPVLRILALIGSLLRHLLSCSAQSKVPPPLGARPAPCLWNPAPGGHSRGG